MKRLFPLLCLLSFLFCASGAIHAQDYQIISTANSTVANNVTKTVTTVQVGNNPLNRFLMTRTRRNIPDHALQGLNFNEAYGHVDHVFSNNHLHEVEHPVLKWLKGIKN